MQVKKLCLASNHLEEGEMSAWKNVVISLLLDNARGSYEHHLIAICEPFWPAARDAARNAVAINDINALTDDEINARIAAHDNCPMMINLNMIHLAIQAMTTELVPTGALRRVKRFMRRNCCKPHDMKIHIFCNHLQRMNSLELPLLPPFAAGNSLNDDELIEIIQYAVPSSWNKKLREQGRDPINMGLTQFLQALEDIEAAEQDFDKALTNSTAKSLKKLSNKKSKKSNKSNAKDGDKENSFFCLKHGKNATHDTNNCHVMKKLATSLEKSKSKNKTWTNKAKKDTTDSSQKGTRRLHCQKGQSRNQLFRQGQG